MKHIALITLVGLPGSGKSHLCSSIQKFRESNFNVIWLDYDKLIPLDAYRNLHGEPTWKKWRQTIILCVEKFITRLFGSESPMLPEESNDLWSKLEMLYDSSDENDLVILLDDNFYYSSMRRPFFLLAKQYFLSYASIVVKCSLDLCLKRNASRTPACSLPSHVIEQMSSKIEWPDKSINSWEDQILVLDTDVIRDNCLENDVQTINRFLIDVIARPLISTSCSDDDLMRMKNQCRLINQENWIHNIDICLRNMVGQIMITKGSDKSKYGKFISKWKSETLQDMKLFISVSRPEWMMDDILTYAKELFLDKINNNL